MKSVLPIVVLAQFCCASIWFASNGVINDLVSHFQLSQNALSYLTSSVQFGFLVGTLVFAIFMLADRFSPSKLFFISALIGGTLNLSMLIPQHQLISLISVRFLIGISLAGIYPIGIKIVADYYKKGLGKSLGYLVGALVLGTALPHLLKSFNNVINWQIVIISISILSFIGGSIVYMFVPDGPYQEKTTAFNIKNSLVVFKNNNASKGAWGYFGHMWELYAFWTFIPLALSNYISYHELKTDISVSLWTFFIIASGAISTVIGGYISIKKGSKNIANIFLFSSFICCLLSPVVFIYASLPLFIIFLFIWSLLVIPDSPLFSTIVAQNVSPNQKGTAITIVNCIGFGITILSILLINYLTNIIPSPYLLLTLILGPMVGLFVLIKK